MGDIDLRKVVLEIEDDVRAKRASGALPAALEKELDAVFAKFAPPGALDGDIAQLLQRAEQQAFFDLIAPNESARKGVSQVKRIVQKTVRWYLRYIVEQITGFSHTVVGILRKLDERVAGIESLTPTQEVWQSSRLRHEEAPTTPWRVSIAAFFRGTSGRVLHASCGNGDLVRALMESEVDAYGVDNSAELVTTGSSTGAGIDLRVEDELAHLSRVTPGSLDGVVLSECVDTLPRGAQVRLPTYVGAALGSGGRVALVVSHPEVWRRAHSTLLTDLAPGTPLGLETWKFLLSEQGFTDIVVHEGERVGVLRPESARATKAAVANLELLNDVLFPPATSLITATKQ